MKKAFWLLLLLITSAQAQNVMKEVQHPDIAARLFKNPKYVKTKAEGTPYKFPLFLQANVEKISVKAFMRYNVYKDEFEFITPKNDTLVLDKIEDFGVVNFEGVGKRYELLPYTKGKKLEYGYLIGSYSKNNWTLYTKENVGFTEAKPAKTTLETNMPARFYKAADSFYLKNDTGSITEFPDGKKALVKAFPSKKDTLEAYLKDNKVDFSDVNDLKRVVDVLAQ